MGFNLYLAGGDSVPLELTPTDNVGILTTFADGPTAVRKFIEKRHCKTFCDSGAYGAAHSGKKIDLDEYIEFINTTPQCNCFAVLDEIPWPQLETCTADISAKNTFKNYEYMIHRVKPEYRDKLIPTYHFGEPIEYLQQIIKGFDDYQPPYIAFGGRAGVSTATLYKFFDNRFWDAVRTSCNPNVKIHAFGVTVFEMLERYPWYSADSTTWLRTGIAGNIHSRVLNRVLNISDQRKGHLNHISNLQTFLYDKVIQEIEERGFTLEELTQDYKKRHLWNCQFFKDWADNFEYKEPEKPKPKRKTIISLK